MFFEVGAVFEVDDGYGGGFVGFDGELVEGDDGVLGFGKIEVSNGGGGGAEESEGVVFWFFCIEDRSDSGG